MDEYKNYLYSGGRAQGTVAQRLMHINHLRREHTDVLACTEADLEAYLAVRRLSTGEEVIQNPWSGIFRSQLKDMNQGKVPTYWPGAVPGYPNNPTGSSGSGGGSAKPEPRNINMNVSGVVDPTLVSALMFQRLKAGMAG